MIFCGDIALPIDNRLGFKGCPDDLFRKEWIGNLEGSLIKGEFSESFLKERKVFNSDDAFASLCNLINYRCVGLANNHLLDASHVNESLEILNNMNMPYIGAGFCLDDARREIVINDYVIIAFGWEGISCVPANDCNEGVNPYEIDHVCDTVCNLLQIYQDKKIICFMHWNYELELYPQPLDRELSHHLIDMGVYAVIGCHAHRVQPIEIYKGHPIVYGLGNFAFMQNTYLNGKLKFPAFSYDEIAFEITDDGVFCVHRFKYDPNSQTVTYIRKETVETSEILSLNDDDYKKFFKKNRVQRKFLPIFYYNDSRLTYRTKIELIKARQKMIKLLIGNKRVFDTIKSVISKIS